MICPLSLVHFTADSFHNRNAVFLKSKIDFLKIPENCVVVFFFFLKPEKNVFA